MAHKSCVMTGMHKGMTKEQAEAACSGKFDLKHVKEAGEMILKGIKQVLRGGSPTRPPKKGKK